MELKTRVKVSGVTNLHDARYCAGMGVELVGFQISKQEQQAVEPSTFSEISSWLQGISYVGEITDLSSTDLSSYPVQYWETTKIEDIPTLKATSKPIILKLAIETADLSDVLPAMERIQQDVELFLLESRLPLEQNIISNLKDLAQDYDFLLGFGVTEYNVLQLIEEISPEGIALHPGKEIKVGVNDFDELADILEQLDTDEFA